MGSIGILCQINEPDNYDPYNVCLGEGGTGMCSPAVIYVQLHRVEGGGPRVVVSTAAFHARVRGSVPGLGG